MEVPFATPRLRIAQAAQQEFDHKLAEKLDAIANCIEREGTVREQTPDSEQGVSLAKAEWTYVNNNLHRLEPLLSQQFVTEDQVDHARSLELAQAEALKQAESQLRLSQVALKSALAQYEGSGAGLDESKAQHQQARHAVTTLEPLINQRGARAAAFKDARYNLDNCRVYAPFDALVTN